MLQYAEAKGLPKYLHPAQWCRPSLLVSFGKNMLITFHPLWSTGTQTTGNGIFGNPGCKTAGVSGKFDGSETS